MKTADFIREHHACRKCAEWALSISDDMAEVWDALVDQGKHSWLLWVVTRPGVFQDPTLRRLACRFVRETPIGGGRTVWDLLDDERSRKAVEVAEAYAEGGATDAELYAAHYAARYAACVAAGAASDAAWAAAYSADAASYSADDSAWASARIAARAAAESAAADAACATYSAAYAAYAAAAKSAQVQMIAELGNPFKEELGNQ